MKTNIAPTLETYLRTLVKNGFDVYLSVWEHDENITYAHFVKGNNIGYVQITDLSNNEALSFSSEHQPSKGQGSGYGIHDRIYDPTVEHATDCFLLSPIWINRRNKVKKYDNWEHYTQKRPNCTYVKFN